MRRYDISFQLTNGNEYGFMLARRNGKKAWAVNRVYYPPPSMVQHRIDITITAREDEVAASGVRQLKRMEEILNGLEAIMAYEGDILLIGLDNRQYPIKIDADGIKIETIIHEKDREAEYAASALLWGLYQ